MVETPPAALLAERFFQLYGDRADLVEVTKQAANITIHGYVAALAEAGDLTQPIAAGGLARDAIAAYDTVDLLEAFEFVFGSPYVGTAAPLADYARPSFPPGRPLLDAVDDLSHRIHADFTYAPNTTAIDTPVLDALRTRKGVCQDFSHVMIGALRSMGLAARYVSGYLRSGADYQGAEASHAWVSVFVPGVGWVDFDPTNDVRPTTNHVTVAWGRDYGDVTPVKGISLGGGGQVVDVVVRVEPVELS